MNKLKSCGECGLFRKLEWVWKGRYDCGGIIFKIMETSENIVVDAEAVG